MGGALVDGLLKNQTVRGSDLMLSGPHAVKLKRFDKDGIHLTTDNQKAAGFGNTVFLSVRPFQVGKVIREIKKDLKPGTRVISVAACVNFELLEKYFHPEKVKTVRLMPNIPVLYGLGVIGWTPNKLVTEKDRKIIRKLLGNLGLVIECKDEDELDRLDILSGCGPGIVAYLMKSYEGAARENGFSQKDSEILTRFVFSGALKHLENSRQSPAELINQVATKGGITEEVLKSLDRGGFNNLLSKSMEKGYIKVSKITDQLKRDL